MKYKKDYYKILGIEPNATPEEIKQAYRRLAILNHPDKNPTRQAAARMQEINEAYSVLGNEHKRINYNFEHGNSSTSTQASTISNNANASTTASLDQFYPEKPNGRYIVLLGIGMLFVFTLFFSIFAVGILFSSGFRITWAGVGVIFAVAPLLSLIPVTLGVFFLTSFISRRKEKQCPKCGKPQAAENLGETTTGIFNKWVHYQSPNQDYSYTYRKYKTHCKCKYCSYEWLYIKTMRLE